MNQLTPRASNNTLINEVSLFASGSLGTSGFSWYDSVYWSQTQEFSQATRIGNVWSVTVYSHCQRPRPRPRLTQIPIEWELNGILRTVPHKPFFSVSVSGSVIRVLNIATVYYRP